MNGDLVEELNMEADAIGVGSGAPTARLLRRAAEALAAMPMPASAEITESGPMFEANHWRRALRAVDAERDGLRTNLATGIRDAQRVVAALEAEHDESMLRTLQVRNAALLEAASQIRPGPDGQDYLDRETLIREWVSEGHDIVEAREAEHLRLQQEVLRLRAKLEEAQSLEAVAIRCWKTETAGLIAEIQQWRGELEAVRERYAKLRAENVRLRQALRLITKSPIEDLLTDEERDALQADLREIAATRRRAWEAAKDCVLP